MVNLHHSMSDNQQERLEIESWICGFVDGEGCFSVSLIRNQTTKHGWQLFPEFVVTQGSKSRTCLERIKLFFKCGQIYENRRHDNHTEHLLRYCVRTRHDLLEKIVPFFRAYPLQTAKRKDFERFVKVLALMERNGHTTTSGLRQAARYIQAMNRKVPSRFLESSETTRRTPSNRVKI